MPSCYTVAPPPPLVSKWLGLRGLEERQRRRRRCARDAPRPRGDHAREHHAEEEAVVEAERVSVPELLEPPIARDSKRPLPREELRSNVLPLTANDTKTAKRIRNAPTNAQPHRSFPRLSGRENASAPSADHAASASWSFQGLSPKCCEATCPQALHAQHRPSAGNKRSSGRVLTCGARTRQRGRRDGCGFEYSVALRAATV